jgi:hypothetical protein
MDTLSSKFSTLVKGVISGFDRIVFKGMIRPLMYSAGMESFLRFRKVLNKDFKNYAITHSRAIIESAEEIAQSQCAGEITHIRSSNERKEALAHKRQEETGVNEGLIGIWSCVESCNTYRSVFNPEQKHPTLRGEWSKCKHLYYYFDDPTYGFMNVRLQTWAPYEIQIALNGREWLRRSLDKAGCGYVLDRNKFFHIDDYELAQRILDEQAKVDFGPVLNGFLPSVFPRMSETLGEGLSYYWMLWQSEVAKDYIFSDSASLSALMDGFQRHALITGNGERILKYFGSPVKAKGQPHHYANPEISTRTNLWYDGLRVRHWQNGNSVKFYNEHNVLRFEMTMNDPTRFKIHRHAENQKKTEPKKTMKMRKGVADISARAKISKDIVDRFSEHMSAAEEKTKLEEILISVSAPLYRKGKRIRAVDLFGKDLEFLRAISDPAFTVSGITNKELQKKLIGTAWSKKMTGKPLTGRVSRHLALLREHGLIRKLPNQRRYALTDKGRKTTAALNAALSASVNDLLKIAA